MNDAAIGVELSDASSVGTRFVAANANIGEEAESVAPKSEYSEGRQQQLMMFERDSDM